MGRRVYRKQASIDSEKHDQRLRCHFIVHRFREHQVTYYFLFIVRDVEMVQVLGFIDVFLLGISNVAIVDILFVVVTCRW